MEEECKIPSPGSFPESREAEEATNYRNVYRGLQGYANQASTSTRRMLRTHQEVS